MYIQQYPMIWLAYKPSLKMNSEWNTIATNISSSQARIYYKVKQLFKINLKEKANGIIVQIKRKRVHICNVSRLLMPRALRRRNKASVVLASVN